MATKKIKSFEDGMEQLEALVRQMEEGKLPLEKSFEAHAQGVKLMKELREMLDAGEKRMTELTEAGEKALNLEDTNEDA